MNDAVVRLHMCVASGELSEAVLATVLGGASSAKECEVLDFKRQLPDTDLEYAKTVRDMVALHNSHGGFLVFGVEEVDKDREFSVVGTEGQSINLAKLRDQARAFLGSDLRIGAQVLALDDKRLEVLSVAKRAIGELPVRFAKNGPEFLTGPSVRLYHRPAGAAHEADGSFALPQARLRPALEQRRRIS
jgi:hypothetical protein